MKRFSLHFIIGVLFLASVQAQMTPGAGSLAGGSVAAGGAPSGAAGGVLSGTYPNPGFNSTGTFGVAKIGTGVSGLAEWSHSTNFGNTTNYAFLNSGAGLTIVNAASGQTVSLRNNNADVAVVSGTGIAVTGVATVSGTTTLGSAGTVITRIRHGITVALSSGTLVVSDTGATANTRYFFTAHTLGTITLPVTYYASARSAGVSFTITSGNVTDTSTVDWLAIEP